MNYLHKDEYLPYAPDGVGEQVRVNHEGCPAGEDTKRRLYIRRAEDGITILAFCHHCRKRGSYNTFATSNIKAAKSRYLPKSSVKSEYVHYPASSCREPREWPSAARAWLYRYGITNKEIDSYGIFYNPDNLRVGIPVFGSGGVGAIQYRRIFPQWDSGPKYTTISSATVPLYRSRSWTSGSSVVLCEDAISTIKCGRHLPAAALIGTYLRDEHIYELVDRFDTFIIFLDDDNSDVRKQELLLKNRLDVFGSARIIHTEKDPKEYSDDELQEILL